MGVGVDCKNAAGITATGSDTSVSVLRHAQPASCELARATI